MRTLIFSTYGRELIDVNSIDTYHLVKYQGEELFPNVRYGFNKKQLIVTTLQVMIFYIRHRDRTRE